MDYISPTVTGMLIDNTLVRLTSGYGVEVLPLGLCSGVGEGVSILGGKVTTGKPQSMYWVIFGKVMVHFLGNQ